MKYFIGFFAILAVLNFFDVVFVEAIFFVAISIFISSNVYDINSVIEYLNRK